jgi:predicted  nucleic acid-binding Zn-ribbon protein
MKARSPILKIKIKDLNDKVFTKTQNETELGLELGISNETVASINDQLKKSKKEIVDLQAKINNLNDQLKISVEANKPIQDLSLAFASQNSRLIVENLEKKLNEANLIIQNNDRTISNLNDQICGLNNLAEHYRKNELIKVDMITRLDQYVYSLENQLANEKKYN